MSGSGVVEGGYVCAPYMHNESSLKLKECLERSDNVDGMYFATATFSEDGNAYFPSHSNTYLLARFTELKLNLISVYYLDYGHSESDLFDLALIVAKRSRVRRAECGTLHMSSTETPKFTFPYNENLVVFEVSSDNTHQSDNKYCEKTRREVARKGIRLTNLVNLSVIEKIK